MTTNQTLEQVADQKLIDGLTKHQTLITALPIGGKTLTPSQAIAIVQARIDSSAASATTKASAHAAVVAARAQRAQSKQFVSALRQVIRSMFGTSTDILADFGLVPPKPHVESPATKVEAAAKARATRALRHTMGKVQKAAIKASSPVPVDTTANPPAAGTAPAAPVTPASPGAPATPVAPTPANQPSNGAASAAPAPAASAGAAAPAATPAGTPAAHS
jgi:hypothetical protein